MLVMNQRRSQHLGRELQGTMGGIYAREAGEPETVWRAIYWHYLPVAVEAEAAPAAAALGPAAIAWASLSLADKLDTVVGLFLAGERPTGSRDPFGLRRAAHGILRILVDAEALTGARVRTALNALVDRALAGYADQDPAKLAEFREHLETFLFERLQYVFEARGADRRNIRAVLATPAVALSVPVSDLHENLRALPEFARSEQFRQLATAFKRIRNIAKDSPADAAASDGDWSKVLKEAAERALLDEIAKRQPAIRKAVASGGGFREAYAEAAGFEPAVARFFNEVFVMADDPGLRKGRLRLMKELEHLILQLGDISEVVASES